MVTKLDIVLQTSYLLPLGQPTAGELLVTESTDRNLFEFTINANVTKWSKISAATILDMLFIADNSST